MADRTPAVEAFWAAYRTASGVGHDRYDVVAMGDSPELADELLALILAGPKRATASLARDYGEGRAPLPAAGDHVVVTDAGGVPRCIWRTTEATVKPLIAVDDAFAWDEGEGDRSRAFWLDAHRTYFARQAVREGFVLTDAEPTVFERFRLVWPTPDP
ncbi:ASCH domain-containing protein [Neoroseomonas eburnea]|uniref:ASCH domain-containing protein n=1 Tax=Neoroseomonas eburnea TaxID=1346889 RepID=UPI0030B9C3FF